MKSLIDSLVVATYLFIGAWGSKYTLSQIAQKTQMMALEKAQKGLVDLTPMTRRMTGREYSW